MFAVPGWSVSSSLLKTQTHLPSSQTTSKKANSKKRKRDYIGNDVEGVRENQPKKASSPQNKAPGPSDDRGPPQKNAEHSKSSNKETETKDLSNHLSKHDNHSSQPSAVPRPEKKRKDRTKNTDSVGARKNGAHSHQPREIELPAQSPSTSKSSRIKDPSNAETTSTKLTPLQSAMRQKLISARFRHLNETLYTTPSTKAASLFETNPNFFDEYHSGFRQQVGSWPENPVDRFVEEIRERGKVREPHGKVGAAEGRELSKEQAKKQDNSGSGLLPRSRGLCRIADLGCGDASLAQQLSRDAKKLNIRVSSYDLACSSELVTKADISRLPVEAGSFDVAIFCLALMGTNWVEFVEEAWRALRWKGELWIAEIKSRFTRGEQQRRRVVEHSVGRARKGGAAAAKKRDAGSSDAVDGAAMAAQLAVEVDGAEAGPGTDVSGFVQLLRSRGFHQTQEQAVDLSNKMFVLMKFVKNTQPLKGRHVPASGPGGQQMPKFLDEAADGEEGDEAAILKPCLYKTR